MCRLLSQVLFPVPALARTVLSSIQMVHVCAELALSSITSWILKYLLPIVNWTVSLRSVKTIKVFGLIYAFFSSIMRLLTQKTYTST